MAALTLFHEFKSDLLKGVHNFSAHTFKVMLTNTAPSIPNDTVKANIVEIAAGNGYVAGGQALDSVAISEPTPGVFQVSCADEVVTASGGSIGPFRYAVIYNDTPTSPADPLVGMLDYGSSVTLADTEPLTLDVGANGLFTL